MSASCGSLAKFAWCMLAILVALLANEPFTTAASPEAACKGEHCTRQVVSHSVTRTFSLRPSTTFIDTDYVSSELETTWFDNVEQWSASEEYCKHADSFNEAVDYWMKNTKQLMSTDKLKARTQQGGEKVFSSFKKTFTCHGVEHQLESWIEPLAFALRTPRSPCPDKSKRMLEDRDYLLLTSGTELRRLACGAHKVRTFYFDLGASTWSFGFGGASQKWFVEAYARRGIKFDRMLLWEAKPHTSAEIFAEVPKEVLGGYQYMNIPATTDKNDPSNPLNILKAITTPEDFVVLKIDIDYHPVEMALIEQLVNDQEVYSRVDEFFFEHHVNFKLMMKEFLDGAGWRPSTSSQDQYLKDSYELFQGLRRKGVRAHGWP